MAYRHDLVTSMGHSRCLFLNQLLPERLSQFALVFFQDMFSWSLPAQRLTSSSGPAAPAFTGSAYGQPRNRRPWSEFFKLCPQGKGFGSAPTIGGEHVSPKRESHAFLLGETLKILKDNGVRFLIANELYGAFVKPGLAFSGTQFADKFHIDYWLMHHHAKAQGKPVVTIVAFSS